jgi:hypothetical protein
VERFLADCNRLALATLALAECELGYLQLQQSGPHTFVAWATSRRLSPEQRERADFDWWSAHVAQQVAPRLVALSAEREHMRARLRQEDAPISRTAHIAGDRTVERYYHQLGRAHVARFACQHSYPEDATIGGATLRQYSDILGLLIGRLLREHDYGATNGDRLLQDEQALMAALAAALHTDPTVIGRALENFILDRDNAAYHSALPGGAASPLIRLDDQRILLSARGLLGEPLIFLTRELRRRYAQEYHNAAHLREDVFRQDVYRLFDDKRFVASPGRVVLRRTGGPRTDIDSLVFDRKTGTLGVFELKAPDPFARSVEERQRQRDNFFYANRQVSAILEWVQRHGPNDLLNRFDERTAKRFRVHKAHVFVLGRYLAHFSGGPEPDRRVAWGSWPQVLQIAETGALNPDHRTPIGALFTRLHEAAPLTAPVSSNFQEIEVGDLRLRIYPSFADMRSGEDRPT